MNEKLTGKQFLNKVLAGMSMGIIISLLPGSLIGEVAKIFGWQSIIDLTTVATRLLAPTMGICIAMQFKLTPIQTGTLAITTMVGAGAVQVVDGTMVLAGMGDVLNAGLTAAVAVALLLLIGDKLKAYTILLLSTIVITIAGLVGLFTLPYVTSITGAIGQVIAHFTTLQPVLMGILIAMTFSFLIMSPISTVGVAMAISLSGIGSGAANLGVCAAGFGLAIAGIRQNSLGTSSIHFLGSAKIQMPNLVRNPKIILPILCNAAVLGALAGVLEIEGTPMSAGFGFSGLVGPLNYLNIVGFSVPNIILTTLMFGILPVVLGFVFKVLFINIGKVVKEEDYLVELD
ncbi:MAG: PTS sugar transporter subunit IIC [Turicibacter sp.]|nr:PTS sugar transporter subunit IIC [Turicibacter sp.]